MPYDPRSDLHGHWDINPRSFPKDDWKMAVCVADLYRQGKPQEGRPEVKPFDGGTREGERALFAPVDASMFECLVETKATPSPRAYERYPSIRDNFWYIIGKAGCGIVAIGIARISPDGDEFDDQYEHFDKWKTL